MSQHRKHPKLDRPQLEGVARIEISLVGATCEQIAHVSHELRQRLENEFRINIVDADHHRTTQQIHLQWHEKQYQYSPFSTESWFDEKNMGQYFDLALVNGNHYPSPHQIVFLQSKKEASLKKRLDQLTDVWAFMQWDTEPYEWLNSDLDIPLFTSHQIDELAGLIRKKLIPHRPKMKALILAGGESLRMGFDKSQIEYHGKSQEVYLAQLCQALGLEAIISKRSGPQEIEGFSVLQDQFLNLGPYGAILTAMKQDRNSAFLVIACDLPNLSKDIIATLLQGRSPSQFMTALKSDEKDFAEPLIAIYEPRMYGRMLTGLSMGYNCPTKILRNTDIKTIEVLDELVKNVNTKAELDQHQKDAI